MSDIRVIHGDSREVLKTFADASMDSVVCDPPYALVSIGKRFGADNAAACKPGKTGAYARASRGFMGKTWDVGDVAFDPAFWAEVLRVLKPGGHLIAFGGTRTYHRLGSSIADAGFDGVDPGMEVRDTIANFLASDTFAGRFFNSLSEEQMRAFLLMEDEAEFAGMAAWTYGSGFPKSHDVSKGIDRSAGAQRETVGQRRTCKGDSGSQTYAAPGEFQQSCFVDVTAPATDAARQWEGWGTALKPAVEPIVLARKPLAGTVAANVLKHGVGGLNIDGCRVDGNPAAWGRRTEGTGGYNLHKREEIAPPSEVGRWPANVVHDGSEEVVDAFPAQAGASTPVRGTEPSVSAKGDVAYGFRNRVAAHHHGDSGSAARFFYSSKADAADRLGSKHPTVKPVDLMAYLCRLVTPPGGTVLDPFAGSGTTGMACLREGFNAVLIEREAEYVADIHRRLKHVAGQDAPLFAEPSDPTLFDEAAA